MVSVCNKTSKTIIQKGCICTLALNIYTTKQTKQTKKTKKLDRRTQVVHVFLPVIIYTISINAIPNLTTNNYQIRSNIFLFINFSYIIIILIFFFACIFSNQIIIGQYPNY